MTNPLLSTPEATAFWREQQQACEEARLSLCKTSEFSAFLAVGGRFEVVACHVKFDTSFVALIKDGDSIIAAIPFYYGESARAAMTHDERLTIKQLTAWLTEARDGVRPATSKTCESCWHFDGGMCDLKERETYKNETCAKHLFAPVLDANMQPGVLYVDNEPITRLDITE